jgi:hypothetical protein
VDEKGWHHAALVRENDSDEVAKQGLGIPADPPDLSQLDCEEIMRDLHNELLARGLLTQTDVVEAQNGVTGAILATFKRRILNLYRDTGG